MLPSVPSTIPDIEGEDQGILAKLDQLPYDQIGADLRTVLARPTRSSRTRAGR